MASWSTEVTSATTASLEITGQSGAYGDAVQLEFSIVKPATAETVGTSGIAADRALERIQLPPEAVTDQGALTVWLEPSLAATMQEGLHYVRSYPYDCIEQTVSRFLPNIATFRALRALGIDNAELATQLPQWVTVGLQRLYATQNLDGGWGWWPGDASDPALTAYVLFGLHTARQARFAVDDQVIANAEQYLHGWLNQPLQDTRSYRDTQALVLHALAQGPNGDRGRLVRLYNRRADMSLYAKGYMLLALLDLAPEDKVRIQTLVNELVDAAILSSAGAHWEEETPATYGLNTDTRTTAIVLDALVRADPQDPLLSQAVRWLITARRSGRWETTQENVWAILALTDYMIATEEHRGNYGYLLQINGETKAHGTITTTTVTQPIRTTVPIQNLDPTEENILVIQRMPPAEGSARGKLYYSAFLNYYLPTEHIKPLNRGLIVMRTYLDEDGQPITNTTQVDAILTVKITVISPRDAYFLVLEDPLPAGCEALDPSLATTRRTGLPEGLGQSCDKCLAPWDYRLWPTHVERRDEKVALFVKHLPKGTYEYSYQLRCTTPGEFHVLPTTAYEMYAPDVFGRSGGQTLTILE